MNCINKKAPEFINLLELTGLHPVVLTAKITVYQDKNGIDAWPTPEYFNKNVNYSLKAVEILSSDKGKQVFEKGKKAGWSLDKILSELQVPKEQKQLILDLKITEESVKSKYDFIRELEGNESETTPNVREEIIINLLANYSYVIEIDTTKKSNYSKDYRGVQEGPTEYVNTDYYSNLTVPGGTNYVEQEISTPLITPSIKGHAQFATDNGIGWFRSDEQDGLKRKPAKSINEVPNTFTGVNNYTVIKTKDGWVFKHPNQEDILETNEKEVLEAYNYGSQEYNKESKTRRILEVQSDLFQKGRDKTSLTNLIPNDLSYNQLVESILDDGKLSREEAEEIANEMLNEKNDTNDNKFLQLINKNNNWVTLFVKSIIQDSAKKGYEKVLFPTKETIVKIESDGKLTWKGITSQEKKEIPEYLKWSIENEGKTYKELIGNKQWKISDNTGNTQIVANQEYEGENGGLYWDGNNYYHLGNKTDKKTIIPFNQFITYFSKIKQFGENRDKLFQDRIVEISEHDRSTYLNPIEGGQYANLVSTAKFYENTLTNVLNKTYSKDNVKVITDEYGNTWNEVEVKKSRDESTIFFQQGNLNFHNGVTFDERVAIMKEIETDPKLKKIFGKYIPEIGGYRVASTREINALNHIGKVNLPFHNNGRPLPFDSKKVAIKNFSSENKGRDNRRIFRLMNIDGEFGQIDGDNNTAPDPLVQQKMMALMSDLGIRMENYEAYKTWYEAKFEKPLDVSALADITLKVIAIKEGKEILTTMPEEVSHFIIYALKDDSYVRSLLMKVEGTDKWKAMSPSYIKLYKGDMEKVRLEILGQLLGDALIDNIQGNISNKWKRMVLEIWNRFMGLFGRTDVKISMQEIASQMLAENSKTKTKVIESLKRINMQEGDNLFAQINPQDFKASKLLNGFKEELVKASLKIEDQINRLDSSGKVRGQDDRKKLLKLLRSTLRSGKITYGIANYINVVETQSEQVLNRINEITENYQKDDYSDSLNKLASLFRDMKDFTLSHKDVISEFLTEVNLQRSSLKKSIAKDIKNVQEGNNTIGDSFEERSFKNAQLLLLNDLYDSLSNITSGLSSFENSYNKFAMQIFIDTASPIIDERFSNRNEADEYKRNLVDLLKNTNDIAFLRRWLDSMAESTDDILGMTDAMTKDIVEKARLESQDKQKDLYDAHEDLRESTGSNDTSWIAERDSEGNVTGNYVEEWNEAEYQKEKDKFFKDIELKYEALFEQYKDDPDEIEDLFQSKDKEIAQWFEDNHQAAEQSTIEQMKARKYKMLQDEFIVGKDSPAQNKRVEEAFNAWIQERMFKLPDGSIQYRKEFQIPKLSKYGNPEYKKIINDPSKAAYYYAWKKLFKESQEHMSDHIYYGTLLPQVRKDLWERVMDKKGNVIQSALKEYNDSLKMRVDDYEYGNPIVNAEDKRIYRVPVMHMNKLENPSEISLDVTSSTSMFIANAIKNRELNKLVDTVELVSDVLKERNVKTKFMGRDITKTNGGKSYERFVDYLQMTYYNKQKEEGSEIFGYDSSKLVDALNAYTSMNSLALNIYAGAANVMYGNMLIREEAFAKQYVTQEDLIFARKTYWSTDGLSNLLSDVGQLRSSNKLRLFLEEVDAFQDFESNTRNINAGRGVKERLFNQSSIYILNHLGEHQLQSRLILAMANNKKLKDSDGNIINLYDAFEVVNYRLVIKKGVTNLDGSEFTKDNVSKFSIKSKAVNQSLNGIYNTIDKNAIQKESVGRLVMLFRKWMKPGLNRRWSKSYYNWSLMEEVEGTHISTLKFLNNLYNEVKESKTIIGSAGKAWNSLSEMQRMNVIRAMSEIGYFIALTIASSLFGALAAGMDDDEEELKWAANMTAYQVNRLATEIGVYTPPMTIPEGLRLIKSPAAAVNQVDKILRLFDIINLKEDEPWLRIYKSGKNKGNTYLYETSKDLIPMANTIEGWFTPEDKLKFFQ